MIYFYSGHTRFGGSTFIINSVVKLLNSAGMPTLFYGPHSWFTGLSAYNRAERFPPLTPKDIFVCHFFEPHERPNVHRSIAYIHEDAKNFRFRFRKFYCEKCKINKITEYSNELPVCDRCGRSTAFIGLKVFDHLVISSVNHEKKYKESQLLLGSTSIIPNPIEINFTRKPPAEPTAGIIGTVEGRKAQHVSIQKAKEAGFKKILLYGPKNPVYFDQYIKPLLDTQVMYKGVCDDRESMYNSISEVFHYAKYEQACMVQGECKKLGIPFHCDTQNVPDWDLYSNEQIIGLWKEILK